MFFYKSTFSFFITTRATDFKLGRPTKNNILTPVAAKCFLKIFRKNNFNGYCICDHICRKQVIFSKRKGNWPILNFLFSKRVEGHCRLIYIAYAFLMYISQILFINLISLLSTWCFENKEQYVKTLSPDSFIPIKSDCPYTPVGYVEIARKNIVGPYQLCPQILL